MSFRCQKKHSEHALIDRFENADSGRRAGAHGKIRPMTGMVKTAAGVSSGSCGHLAQRIDRPRRLVAANRDFCSDPLPSRLVDSESIRSEHWQRRRDSRKT